MAQYLEVSEGDKQRAIALSILTLYPQRQGAFTMNSQWKRVLIPCAIAAVLMLGISYAGIQYFKSQGIWYDDEGNAHADIWV
ncbi:hypothetical protein H6G00_28850 [Leptolyngbya sp. FACHB-541]|uniref:hypothetical protein n=1 Tax=Leptolyngbya sp. FACHB-541 TaxID=2692810 RepID=UPI001684366C|nr:hypothetical protein [Leptolyngbya sp. FACHB-541]MBD2000567.1 hypothetical protein [Leptolyngbya sp. FACHB-541]